MLANIIGDAIFCILRYYKPIFGKQLFFTKFNWYFFVNFHRNREICKIFVRILLVMHFPTFWGITSLCLKKKSQLFVSHQSICMPIEIPYISICYKDMYETSARINVALSQPSWIGHPSKNNKIFHFQVISSVIMGERKWDGQLVFRPLVE